MNIDNLLDNYNSRNMFVVLGFARSGTSVITRGLKALGVDLGTGAQKETNNNKWNPSGFFEDEEIIYHIHTNIFEILDYKVREIRIIDNHKLLDKKLQAPKQNAKNLLKKRYLNTYDFGFKDPNTAKLLPFWQDVFQDLSLTEKYIIALRNPLSSASSFSNLTNIDLEASLILWLTHIIPAIDETKNKNRIVVNYDSMLSNPQQQLKRIKQHLNINSKKENLDSFANEYLDLNLQHNNFNEDDLKNHSACKITPLCRRVYGLLNKVAKDEILMESETFEAAWDNIKIEFDYIYPIYCYIDTLLKKNSNLNTNLKNISKSITWKALHPLRIIDDKLRDSRKKHRNKKRLDTAYE